nr:hypothetical protein MtrunA17_Chr4g0034151 [Ipomoea trifida]GLL46951.1 hypothetical protein MtrunA17_Chr4g0034151 [Ipomoea trifida]
MMKWQQREEPVVQFGEGLDEHSLDGGVFGLRGVEEGEHTVAAGELSRRHVCTCEDIPLLRLGHVEQDGKANRIKKNHNLWVFGYERTRWHVASKHTGFILLLSASKELISALVVEEIVAVGDGPKNGDRPAEADGI